MLVKPHLQVMEVELEVILLSLGAEAFFILPMEAAVEDIMAVSQERTLAKRKLASQIDTYIYRWICSDGNMDASCT